MKFESLEELKKHMFLYIKSSGYNKVLENDLLVFANQKQKSIDTKLLAKIIYMGLYRYPYQSKIDLKRSLLMNPEEHLLLYEDELKQSLIKELLSYKKEKDINIQEFDELIDAYICTGMFLNMTLFFNFIEAVYNYKYIMKVSSESNFRLISNIVKLFKEAF